MSLLFEEFITEYVSVFPVAAILIVILLIYSLLRNDRILKLIPVELRKSYLALSDTHMVLLTGVAVAVFYSLLSLPLARASDRGSPRLALVSCILPWSAVTVLGGIDTQPSTEKVSP